MNPDANFSPAASRPAKPVGAKSSSLRPAGWGFFIYLILLVILTVWIGPMIAQSNSDMANAASHPVAAAAHDNA
jgi:hypothetical protein